MDPASDAPAPGRLSFGPTSGFFSGVLGLVFAAVLVVLSLVHGPSETGWRVIACACLGAAISWTLMLRPRVVFEPDSLVLRNMVTDTVIPYERLDSLVVRSVTQARAGGRQHVGLAVGRTRRAMAGGGARQRSVGGGLTGVLERRAGVRPEDSYAARTRATTNEQVPDIVEKQAADRIRNAAAREDTPPVRRRTAVPEIIALVVTGIGVLLAFLL